MVRHDSGTNKDIDQKHDHHHHHRHHLHHLHHHRHFRFRRSRGHTDEERYDKHHHRNSQNRTKEDHKYDERHRNSLSETKEDEKYDRRRHRNSQNEGKEDQNYESYHSNSPNETTEDDKHNHRRHRNSRNETKEDQNYDYRRHRNSDNETKEEEKYGRQFHRKSENQTEEDQNYDSPQQKQLDNAEETEQVDKEEMDDVKAENRDSENDDSNDKEKTKQEKNNKGKTKQEKNDKGKTNTDKEKTKQENNDKGKTNNDKEKTKQENNDKGKTNNDKEKANQENNDKGKTNNDKEKTNQENNDKEKANKDNKKDNDEKAAITQPVQKIQMVVVRPVAGIEMKQAQNDLLPYWEEELLKGAPHLKLHQRDFKAFKRKEGKVLDVLNRKESVCVTSGIDDMSLSTLATIHEADRVPDTGSAGLLLLNGIDKILIQPKVVIRDAVLPWNSQISRFFFMVNASGHKIYRIEEKRSFFRKSEFTILDLYVGLKVGLMIRRRLFTTHYRARMDVYSPPASYIGCVERVWGQFTFRVRDVTGNIIFKIKLENNRCFAKRENMKFIVRTPDGTETGEIRSTWDDLTYILYLNHPLYGILFPVEMDVIHKLLLMASTLMIYYAVYDGRIVRQAIHLPKKSAKKFIEYAVLSASDPSLCVEGLSRLSSISETESIEPVLRFD